MSYVDNTSLGLLLAAARPAAAGETYWIADPPPYSMNEIVGTVESVLEDDFGMHVAHNRAPPAIGRIRGRLRRRRRDPADGLLRAARAC
jgi:nucleoside-diphosphate-sugar epimerase